MNGLLLPPTEKRRQHELRALALRDFARVSASEPLDPFALAHFARLLVVDFELVEGLTKETRDHLLGEAAGQWSGGACANPLPNGWRVVILNPTHGRRRNRATLMEEICHVFLGHKANRLAVIGRDKQGRTMAREYNAADEEAAYAIGAASLAPYAALRRFVLSGKGSYEMGRHFGVSRELVEYRLKVTRLWAGYQKLASSVSAPR
jgi:uncharacterized protein DUF955